MKRTYIVNTPVDHDKKRYPAESPILLSDEDAAGLLIVKAITLDPDGPVEADAATVPTDPAERLSAIITAIGKLDPNNQDQWLQGGKPAIDAIAAITGWPVTAAERNGAFEAYSAPPAAAPAAPAAAA